MVDVHGTPRMGQTVTDSLEKCDPGRSFEDATGRNGNIRFTGTLGSKPPVRFRPSRS